MSKVAQSVLNVKIQTHFFLFFLDENIDLRHPPNFFTLKLNLSLTVSSLGAYNFLLEKNLKRLFMQLFDLHLRKNLPLEGASL